MIDEKLPQTREGSPYLHIRPLDLDARLIGQAGFITFHLDESDHFGRRTLIFEKQKDAWQLVHLHASNMGQ